MHPDTLTALGKLRAEELIREAAEWRASLRAAESIPQQRGRIAQALASWLPYLRSRRAESAPLAGQEES